MNILLISRLINGLSPPLVCYYHAWVSSLQAHLSFAAWSPYYCYIICRPTISSRNYHVISSNSQLLLCSRPEKRRSWIWYLVLETFRQVAERGRDWRMGACSEKQQGWIWKKIVPNSKWSFLLDSWHNSFFGILLSRYFSNRFAGFISIRSICCLCWGLVYKLQMQYYLGQIMDCHCKRWFRKEGCCQRWSYRCRIICLCTSYFLVHICVLSIFKQIWPQHSNTSNIFESDCEYHYSICGGSSGENDVNAHRR